MKIVFEQSQEEFLERCRRQTNSQIHYLLRISVLIDMVEEKNKKIIELEEKIKRLEGGE